MNAKKHFLKFIWAAALLTFPWVNLRAQTATPPEQHPAQPSQALRQARQQFADRGFGIFLHWGIYSIFGQGEWYLNYGPSAEEYAKAARGFYPAYFDAAAWVKAVKEGGAKYITFTSRHHDGFSMWDTKQSDYNIVKGTPFGRDIVKELADECHKQGIALHLYYSLLDWTRQDYPLGRTGHTTGRDTTVSDWPQYLAFMKAQLTELLTQYGEIGAVWFDGVWDHDEDTVPFDWQLDELYSLIHDLQPSCLVGNNHHLVPFPGEDIQIFERDLPGCNEYGYSGQDITSLPLETCQTMNGMWGYKIKDQNYKSTTELVRYLVGAAGKGANLLLNIGPQPSGELPAAALERLRDIGAWLNRYGETVYGTTAGDFPARDWGTSTRKGNRLFVHILTDGMPSEINLPLQKKVKKVYTFDTGEKVKFKQNKDRSVELYLGADLGNPAKLEDIPADYILVVETE